MYALIDCNNFFVSCERIFRPDIAGMPTIVLSSNDGCAVARSNEAKALGIAMGAPLHELKHQFAIINGGAGAEGGTSKGERRITSLQHSTFDVHPQAPPLVAFSANFELYGDISRRITDVLTHITPRIEIYSIDEAFLDLSQLNIPDYAAWGRALARKIANEIGVPVSVGIAPTKTLCKLAADYAKKHPECHAALYLDTLFQEGLAPPSGDDNRLRSSSARSAPGDLFGRRSREALGSTPIQDIWGIGWRLAPKLKAEGIHTALDLASLPPKRAQQLMGIQGRRTVAELNAISCIPLSYTHKPQQIISRGRQFGQDTNDILIIEAAVARMAAQAGEALRREQQLARRATVTLSTNRKKPGYTVLRRTVHLYTPTAHTGTITRQLVELLRHQFDTRPQYHKAEVTLWDLQPSNPLQTDVFGFVSPEQHEHSTALMQAIDHINERYGHHIIRYAAENLSHAWRPRCKQMSPHYTTSWSELPGIKA